MNSSRLGLCAALLWWVQRGLEVCFWKAEERWEPLGLEIDIWIYTTAPIGLFLWNAVNPQVQVSKGFGAVGKLLPMQIIYPSPPKDVWAP